MPRGRSYPALLAISRSGTTSEIGQLLRELGGRSPTVAITGVGDTPVQLAAGRGLVLDFADEESVVQTRFATSTLVLLRTALGVDVDWLVSEGERALELSLPDTAGITHFVFLGTGWTVGLAQEAALKTRETAGAWAEAYPAMEYRHGPIAVAGPRTLAWIFGPSPAGLIGDIEATGARVVTVELDPLAQLIMVQRLAVALARAAGRNPDRPLHLARSVILLRP